MNYATEIDRAIDSDELARALTVAEQWIAETPDDDAAWSKLAHVHVMGGDFGLASSAVREALRIAPDYPLIYSSKAISSIAWRTTHQLRAPSACVPSGQN